MTWVHERPMGPERIPGSRGRTRASQPLLPGHQVDDACRPIWLRYPSGSKTQGEAASPPPRAGSNGRNGVNRGTAPARTRRERGFGIPNARRGSGREGLGAPRVDPCAGQSADPCVARSADPCAGPCAAEPLRARSTQACAMSADRPGRTGARQGTSSRPAIRPAPPSSSFVSSIRSFRVEGALGPGSSPPAIAFPVPDGLSRRN